MSDRPLMHPAVLAMIARSGRTVAQYMEATEGVTHYKTVPGLGDPATRLMRMPGLPGHVAGLTHRDEMMMSIHLTPQVRFLTGTPDDGASIMMDDGMLPDTLGLSIVGRHVCDVIDHPMLRVDGLEIVKAEPGGPPYNGQVRLRLSAVRWRRT